MASRIPARRVWDPDLTKVGRRIDGIHNEFERGVCEALYRSPDQRRRRIAIAFALGLKHGLRGLLFSWPLYLLGFAALALPHASGRWLALFLLPGLWVSGVDPGAWGARGLPALSAPGGPEAFAVSTVILIPWRITPRDRQSAILAQCVGSATGDASNGNLSTGALSSVNERTAKGGARPTSRFGKAKRVSAALCGPRRGRTRSPRPSGPQAPET